MASTPSALRRARPTTRLNRWLLAVVGVLLLLAGLAALAVGSGRLPGTDAGAPVLTLPTPLPGWVPWVAAVAGVIVGLLGLRWLVAQLRRRPRATGWADVVSSRSESGALVAGGRTTLDSSAAVEPFVEELEEHLSIDEAGARLFGDPSRPALLVEVTVVPGSDMTAVRTFVVDEAVARVRQALDREDLPVDLRLLVGGVTRPERVS